VHGTGMDEISPLAPTHVVEIRDGRTTEWTINPAEFGYSGLNAADLAGSTPDVNAKIILAALKGEGNRAVRGALVLNAGAALCVAGKSPSFREGVAAAEKGVDAGAGLAGLERLRAAYR
ncbi:MAG TPA: hypothetical protein VF483_04330, partial [Gemmatimonadaceae bacterium]